MSSSEQLKILLASRTSRFVPQKGEDIGPRRDLSRIREQSKMSLTIRTSKPVHETAESVGDDFKQ
jgi:hypothetical protein